MTYQYYQSPFEMADALGKWMEYDNERYLYSTLGYRSPEKFGISK
jgi:hypothetical protein